jgi:hypothetical protein
MRAICEECGGLQALILCSADLMAERVRFEPTLHFQTCKVRLSRKLHEANDFERESSSLSGLTKHLPWTLLKLSPGRMPADTVAKGTQRGHFSMGKMVSDDCLLRD